MLSHDVYFTLRDRSPAAVRALVDACHARLAGIEGILSFSAGAREPSLARDVNDRGFDVALHVVFADVAAHDAYQDDPEHHRFVEENRSSWAAVRVFDSTVTGRAR